MDETDACAGCAADFHGIDDLPRHLRTCAAMQPEVQVILPARVALQLARRIEAGRAVPPEPVAFSWLDGTERALLLVAAVLLLIVLVAVSAGFLA